MRRLVPIFRRSGVSPARSAVAVLLAAGALGAAGCGGEDGPVARTVTGLPEGHPPVTIPPRAPAPPRREGANPLEAPRNVPRRATGPADPDEVRVLARWLRAVRQGRVSSAARMFALPSLAQNGTPVLRLTTPEERLAFTSSLSCGAKIREVGAARGFLVVRYELTDRVNGNCGSGVGGSARGAVKVRGGRIVEWYRLDELVDRAPPAGSVEA